MVAVGSLVGHYLDLILKSFDTYVASNVRLALELAFLIIGVIGVIILIFTLVIPYFKNPSLFKNKIITTSDKSATSDRPIFGYGKIVVRKSRSETHGGIYNYSRYYVEVINTTPNSLALNCEGSIDLPHARLSNRSTVWEKNNDYTIEIGHKEQLYLFEVSSFEKIGEATKTRLYFYNASRLEFPDMEDIGTSYEDKLDRRLTVLIQSLNAEFPNRSDTFSKTIRQIRNEAEE